MSGSIHHNRKPRAYSIPHLLQIELTYKCNFKCRFCYNPNRNAKVDYEKIEKIVQRVMEANIPHVYLMGGEPSCIDHDFIVKIAERLVQVSSVTLVTNGYLTISNLPANLACVGIPLHGPEKMHDHLTCRTGSFKHAIKAIRYYQGGGFPVRVIPVLTQLNYMHIIDIARIAAQEGCHAIFVDRYEDGGLGSINSSELKPSLDATSQAITQMIEAQERFGILTTFGTAFPFCLDSRITQYQLAKDCGAGFSFASVNPQGEFRACNQSDKSFGNVLDKSISDIWNSGAMQKFRELHWVMEPCQSCPYLPDCFCGCKVDCSSGHEFSIDYAVRDHGLTAPRAAIHRGPLLEPKGPNPDRIYRPSPLSRINASHDETFLVTRYQTVQLDKNLTSIVYDALKGPFRELEFKQRHNQSLDGDALVRMLSLLDIAGAFE